MKLQKTIFILGLLLLSITACCNMEQSKTVRKVERSFQVSPDSYFRVENKYGNITLTTWGKNEILCQVEIIVKGEDPKIAQQIAGRINIDFSQNSNQITAKTIVDNIKTNRNFNNYNTTVNYTIHIPEAIFLDLSNKYGNTILDHSNRNFNADIKYGNLTIGALSGSENDIKLKYGNLALRRVTNLDLTLGYSKSTIGEANTLTLNSSYSNYQIDEVHTLNLACKYDKYIINKLGAARISSAPYTDFRISQLSESLEIPDIKYGKIKINTLDPGFKSIAIQAQYTNISIAGINKQHNFNVLLTTRYGHIKTPQLNKSEHVTPGNKYTETVKGILGDVSSPSASIRIQNSYGDIILE